MAHTLTCLEAIRQYRDTKDESLLVVRLSDVRDEASEIDTLEDYLTYMNGEGVTDLDNMIEGEIWMIENAG